MQKASGNQPSKLLIGVTIWFIITSFVHRPLPKGFTDGVMDRFSMHLIEPILRITYYWPAEYLCPNAGCRLTLTRAVLSTLSKVIDPRNLFDRHPTMQLSTEYFDGVRVRVYQPKGNKTSDGAVVFIHGGGFVMGSTEIYEGLMRRMTKMLNMMVVSIDYRLAPEATYPGGLHDVERALTYLINNAAVFGLDPTKIVLMGDSAGGNLVAAVTQRMRTVKGVDLAGQVLLYPLLQFHNLQTESFRHYYRDFMGFALVDPYSLAFYYMWYAGIDVNKHPELALSAISNGHVSPKVHDAVDDLLDFTSIPSSLQHDNLPAILEPKENSKAIKLLEQRLMDPSFAPLIQRNLTDLPPSFVMTCQFDILRDEGVLYAKRMREAGVPVEWKHYDHGFHAMLNFHNELFIAQEALSDIVSWVKRLLETS
ncbi:unnamed protein product, partial [Mesorhabditis belari]|uniref:Alpha/beta hydrolase fold-3 domain-containing protein n=1 Tax=Mesorhabditis belari TaxID=2138241 RepID=A0AAF3JBF2_9BILA